MPDFTSGSIPGCYWYTAGISSSHTRLVCTSVPVGTHSSTVYIPGGCTYRSNTDQGRHSRERMSSWVLDEVCLLERAILAPRKAFLGVLDLFCTSPSGLRNVEKSLWIDRVLSAYILTALVQLCVTCGLFCRQKLFFWSSLSSILDTFSCNDIYETSILELSTTVCARRGWQIFSVCWLPVFWCGSVVGIGGCRYA